MAETVLNANLNVSTATEAIQILGQQLMELGCVKASYVDAVLQREATLPTGLKTGYLDVAIPHTDTTHVIKSAVAISTLKKPVKFRLMEDPSQEVDVEIVFLLAVHGPEEQMVLLKNLMGIFQDKKLLERLQKAEDNQQLYDVLQSSVLFEGIK